MFALVRKHGSRLGSPHLCPLVPADALKEFVSGSRQLSEAAQLLNSGGQAKSAERTPEQCLQQAITADVARRISMEGYAVIDGVFGSEACASLKAEIKMLKAAGRMHFNSTHFVSQAGRSLLAKSNIHEADLLQPDTFAAAPQFSQMQNDTGFLTMLNLFLPGLRLDSQAIKLQVNIGSGGCFPIHFDSDESVDARRISAIVYLNESWKPSDGGELRLYPSWKEHVDIAPLNNRLVLFPSCRMPHRVMPSSGERYCFTIWASQTRQASKALTLAQVLSRVKQGELSKAEGQLQPEVWKAVLKLRHMDDWRQSFLESHPNTTELEQILDNLDREHTILEKAVLSTFGVGSLEDLVASFESSSRLRHWL